jgi:UDP-N-acetylmuramoyl-tripeptide--D-alanyl-D-alanine ligase
MSIAELYQIYINANYSVYTDTRKPILGAVFFALQGKGFNGNLYAKAALSQGASYAIVDEDVDSDNPKIIKVSNVLHVLQELATYHRKNCNAKILAIGGSNGKTTTKELISLVLSKKYKIHATPGNYNNHIGLPLTLLSMPTDTEIAITELGTNQQGDIAELCKISQPDLGLITNIGKEHLEGFGNIEAIAHEESHLFNHLFKNNGFAFVNEDDPWLANMSKRLKHKLGFSVGDFIIHKTAPKIHLETLTGRTFTSLLAGLHNVSNLSAARAVGMHFGVDEFDIASAIASYKPENMRSQWIQKEHNLIFLDAYNANPSSMEAALKTLATMPNKPKSVILGDMFELGSHSVAEHQNILELAKQLGFEKIITVGDFFSKVNHHPESFEKTDDLKDYLQNTPIKNHTILVKGSRGMKLEDVLPYL